MKSLKNYPLTLLFFAFLAIFALAGFILPSKKTSELENRELTQAPIFTVSPLASGSSTHEPEWRQKYNALATACTQWTMQYNEYTKDQLPLRDDWISLQSIFETAQGKLENGGVWYAKDGYQIAKNDILTESQALTIEANTQAISDLASRYPGMVNVMIVPSPANTLQDHLRWNPPSINENALLDNTFSQIEAAGGNVLDLRPVFHENKDQQIYYRTDHHWTTGGGAWLGYKTFTQSQGLAAIPPSEELLVQVPSFYGTNYAKSKKFGTQPDSLEYFNFTNPITIYNLQKDGTIAEETLPLMNEEKLTAFDKYGAFLQGNNGYSTIQGNGEGSILVIKDSYGNSFVPFLIENYAQIGIIDLRFWLEVDQTIQEGGYENILVLYSFDNFSQDAYLRKMSA